MTEINVNRLQSSRVDQQPEQEFALKVTDWTLYITGNVFAWLHICTIWNYYHIWYDFQMALINTRWAAPNTRFWIKGHWVTFNGHRNKWSFALHIYTIWQYNHKHFKRLSSLGTKQQPRCKTLGCWPRKR